MKRRVSPMYVVGGVGGKSEEISGAEEKWIEFGMEPDRNRNEPCREKDV
jgi:hypothetical protein